MKYKDAAYICDGYGCDMRCAETMTEEEWKAYDCHHTTDESHAKHKSRRSRKMKLDPDDGKFFEVE